MALKENLTKMNIGLKKSLAVKGVKRLDDGTGKKDKRSALENTGNINLNKKENKQIDPRFEKENKQILSVNKQKAVENKTYNKTKYEILMEVDEDNKKIGAAMEFEEDAMEVDDYFGDVIDIDKYDEANPQLAAEYANEIYSYMRKIEKEVAIKADYMGKSGVKGKESWHLHPKMRAVLVDWLVEVHHQFQLLQETLYLTVAVVDRYLSINAHNTKRSELQLVGVTAMFIACKYEETYCPQVADFVYITDNAYSKDQIKAMERNILTGLDFSLGRPLPLHFLRRGSKAAFAGTIVHTLAKYIMELAMVQYDLLNTPPSLIAATSLLLALRLAQKKADNSLNGLWTPTLVHYTAYNFEDLKLTTHRLARVVATAKNNKHLAVMRKYTRKKFMKVALLPQLQLAENIVEE